MSRQDDLQTNRDIRRVLVRHWIDLGRISVRTCNGIVRIGGTLTRITGHEEELTPAIVEAIFREIEAIRSVRRVGADLDNWTNSPGKWAPAGEMKSDRPAARYVSSGTGAYELDGDGREP